MAAQAMRAGVSLEEIHEASQVRPWFLREVERIVHAENEVTATACRRPRRALRKLKALGFSDTRLAQLAGVKEAEVAALRGRLGVQPVYKRIDTCAAEFASDTPYMYSTYEGGFGTPVCESRPTDAPQGHHPRRRAEPHRPGHRVRLLLRPRLPMRCARPGFETIMVNCNPETVSTDYDTSDRLYFEPLTAEDVIALIRKEQESGERARLHRPVWRPDAAEAVARRCTRRASRSSAPAPRRSTSPRTASASSNCCKGLGLQAAAERHRPHARRGRSARPNRIGYPVVVRPSYVLGGRAMEIAHNRRAAPPLRRARR